MVTGDVKSGKAIESEASSECLQLEKGGNSVGFCSLMGGRGARLICVFGLKNLPSPLENYNTFGEGSEHGIDISWNCSFRSSCDSRCRILKP